MKYLKVWTSFLDVIQPAIQPETGPLYTDDAIGRLFIMMLKYAESGAVAQAKGKTDAKRTAGVVQAAYDHLTKQGYRVHRDIGCSAYKIDLAVTDPNDETRYVLGIECDGPSYARQATARDRDQTRQSVLKGLGWNMFRLWSVEWAFDRDKAEKELDDAVKSALSKWK